MNDKSKQGKTVDAFYMRLPSKHVIISRDSAGNVLMQGVGSAFSARTAAHAQDKRAFEVNPENILKEIAEAGFKRRPTDKQ